jgi:hypothetical protein
MNLYFDNPAVAADFLRSGYGLVCGVYRIPLGHWQTIAGKQTLSLILV